MPSNKNALFEDVAPKLTTDLTKDLMDMYYQGIDNTLETLLSLVEETTDITRAEMIQAIESLQKVNQENDN